MIIGVYCVFDAKAGIFGTPFCQHSDGLAIRDFTDAVNDGSNPNNMWHKHPEDFSLFKVGEYDQKTGELLPSLPSSLVTASSLSVRVPIVNGVGAGQKELFH